MIKNESIEALKSVIDIVDVVSSYIEIKKFGANYKSPCPFHSEKTPSFVVSPSKQIYHCFGCHASGDAIKFVQEYEKISYPDALDKLATMYNIKLERDISASSSPKKSDVAEKFNDYYKRSLEAIESAKSYLLSRGVFGSSIERFELGYAPNSRAQIDFLKSSFLSESEAVDFGIMGEDGAKIYARLVDRISFPIRNQNGKLIGFGGRTITNHPAKYLNSPQTNYFNKSKIFYGLNLAKEAIARQKSMIICEGYMDVIMLHQSGFHNAVAVLGTALTKEHLPTIKKFDASAVLAFDSDKAGLSAAVKSARLLFESGIGGGVAIFEKGLDPADMAASGKTRELGEIFAKTKPFVEFLFESIASSFDLSAPAQKEAAAHEAREILKLSSQIFIEEYRRLAAAILKLPLQTLKVGSRQTAAPIPQDRYDVAEASAIKTMIKNHSLLEMAANRIEEGMFSVHGELFADALAGEFETPAMIELEGNDKIAVMNEEELTSFLIAKSAIFYDKLLVKTRLSTSLTSEQKSFYMRKIMLLKERLKKGELCEIDALLLQKLS